MADGREDVSRLGGVTPLSRPHARAGERRWKPGGSHEGGVPGCRPDDLLTEEDFSRIPAKEAEGGAAHLEPAVSVLMITWNHEPYIAQAIEGVLEQDFGRPFELLIGEDCSSDRTREICEAYRERFPDRVRVVTSPANVGMHRNFARIWHRARGEYVAFCEGDDYWVDRRKLAKQVEFLERHEMMSFCGTLARKVEAGEDGDWSETGLVGPCEEKPEYSVEDLIPCYNFHFSTVCLRRERVRFPRWLWEVYCVDRPLYLLGAENGPAGFIPEVTSVYRIHEGGVWGIIDPLEKAEKSIHLFACLDRHFGFRYRRRFAATLAGILWSYMSEAMERGELAAARELFRESLSRDPSIVPLRLRTAVWLRLFRPRLYKGLRRVGVSSAGRQVK